MLNQANSNQISENQIELLERGASIALLIGVFAVFQWSYQALFQVGLFLLAFGLVATFASQILKREKWLSVVERIVILFMMIGILGMLQSWNIWFYENGFYLLAISTLTFIIVQHIPPPEAD